MENTSSAEKGATGKGGTARNDAEKGAAGKGGIAGNDAENCYEALAHELMRQGFKLARLRPAHELESSSRGLPAVMQALACADGPLSPGEIARATHVTDARVANALRVLESRGLVERRASTRDRRRVEVSLTEAGRADIAVREREGVRFMAEFLREMGEDDARDLLRVLSRVVEVVERRRSRGEGLGDFAPCVVHDDDSPAGHAAAEAPRDAASAVPGVADGADHDSPVGHVGEGRA